MQNLNIFQPRVESYIYNYNSFLKICLIFNYNLQMASIKPTLQSAIIAIAYSAAVKQIIKICKTNEEANSKLFQLGEQIGMRVADEYQQRETNSYKPQEVTTIFLKGILKQYMGCEVIILDKQIKYLKNKFVITFRVLLKENPLADFVILSKNQKQDESGPLNYHSIILGFANGCMRSMSYNPTVRLLSDSLINENQGESSPNLHSRNETMFEVDMWKEKQED